MEWTDTPDTVAGICEGFRHHLLSIVGEPWAGNFWRAMRSLCRDLGRAVGQVEERPVGKCANPTVGTELCRGQLFRLELGGVYCRRCGDKPDIRVQPAWVTLREAAIAVGRPIETVRTWYKRGKLNWPHIGPAPLGKAWLPAVASLATEPQASDIVNHGSRAELSSRPPFASACGPTDSYDGQRSDPQSAGTADRTVREASIHLTQPAPVAEPVKDSAGRGAEATGVGKTPPGETVSVAPPTAETDP